MVVTKYEPNLDEPTTIVAVSYICDVRCRRLVAHCYLLVAIEFVFGAKRKLVLGLSKYFHNLEKEARMQEKPKRRRTRTEGREGRLAIYMYFVRGKPGQVRPPFNFAIIKKRLTVSFLSISHSARKTRNSPTYAKYLAELLPCPRPDRCCFNESVFQRHVSDSARNFCVPCSALQETNPLDMADRL